jgi:hypothetical protein
MAFRAQAVAWGKASLGRMMRVKGAGSAATSVVGEGTSCPTNAEVGEGTVSRMGAVMVEGKVPAGIISSHSGIERVEV